MIGMLASMDVGEYIVHHMEDQPWEGCQFFLGPIPVTWMSSGISAMILAGLVLLAIIIPLARRVEQCPRGGQNLLEVLVVFVRDNVARPALHQRAYAYLPFLTTLFVFILAVNLVGLLPIGPLVNLASHYVAFLKGRPVGGAATSIATVCLAMAGIALISLVGAGWVQSARRFHRKHHRWPWALCMMLSPVLWFVNLSPPVEGVTGAILWIPLAVLELMGACLKCTSLMIRLCANMLAGHVLLAVLMLFILQTLALWLQYGSMHVFYVAPLCIAAAALASVLEIMVAGIQAYIFTFLTAIFLGMYAEASH
jgi:F-type H+-transporting ATPase subunit a